MESLLFTRLCQDFFASCQSSWSADWLTSSHLDGPADLCNDDPLLGLKFEITLSDFAKLYRQCRSGIKLHLKCWPCLRVCPEYLRMPGQTAVCRMPSLVNSHYRLIHSTNTSKAQVCQRSPLECRERPQIASGKSRWYCLLTNWLLAGWRDDRATDEGLLNDPKNCVYPALGLPCLIAHSPAL